MFLTLFLSSAGLFFSHVEQFFLLIFVVEIFVCRFKSAQFIEFPFAYLCRILSIPKVYRSHDNITSDVCFPFCVIFCMCLLHYASIYSSMLSIYLLPLNVLFVSPELKNKEEEKSQKKLYFREQNSLNTTQHFSEFFLTRSPCDMRTRG